MEHRGLSQVIRQYGPFEEIFLLSDGFGWQSVDGKGSLTLSRSRELGPSLQVNWP